jgi:hypothetical protein
MILVIILKFEAGTGLYKVQNHVAADVDSWRHVDQLLGNDREISKDTTVVSKLWLLIRNRGIAFSAWSVPMAVHATLEYVNPPLSNNCTVTGRVFTTRYVSRR